MVWFLGPKTEASFVNDTLHKQMNGLFPVPIEPTPVDLLGSLMSEDRVTAFNAWLAKHEGKQDPDDADRRRLMRPRLGSSASGPARRKGRREPGAAHPPGQDPVPRQDASVRVEGRRPGRTGNLLLRQPAHRPLLPGAIVPLDGLDRRRGRRTWRKSSRMPQDPQYGRPLRRKVRHVRQTGRRTGREPWPARTATSRSRPPPCPATPRDQERHPRRGDVGAARWRRWDRALANLLEDQGDENNPQQARHAEVVGTPENAGISGGT